MTERPARGKAHAGQSHRRSAANWAAARL